MTAIKGMDETKLAEEIVSVLEPSALRACSPERDVIRYAVRSGALKLRTIVFSRAALRRLLSDAAALVKIDYLKRDLLRTADQRATIERIWTAGGEIVRVNPVRRSLEDIFISLVRGEK